MRPSAVRILGALLALGVVALSVQGPAAGATMSLTAPQGGTITISGMVSVSENCPAGTPVQLTSAPASGGANLFPNGMGPQVPRDASGNFQVTYVIAPSTPVGSYTIGVRCGTSTAGASQVLNVTAAAGPKPSLSVAPASAAPGSSVTITGVLATAGAVFCPSGDAVELTSTAALFAPDGRGPTVTRDAGGNFHTTYTIPAKTAPGAYSIGVRCGGGSVVVSANLQVTAAATTTTITTVPATTTTAPTTTIAPAGPSTTVGRTTTTVAPSTTTVPHKKSSANKGPVRWVALGLLIVVVAAAAGVLLATRGKSRSGGAGWR